MSYLTATLTARWFVSEKHVVEDDALFTNSNPLHKVNLRRSNLSRDDVPYPPIFDQIFLNFMRDFRKHSHRMCTARKLTVSDVSGGGGSTHPLDIPTAVGDYPPPPQKGPGTRDTPQKRHRTRDTHPPPWTDTPVKTLPSLNFVFGYENPGFGTDEFWMHRHVGSFKPTSILRGLNGVLIAIFPEQLHVE